MSGSTITAEYKARIEELEAEWSRSRRRHTVAAAVTVAAVALVVILGAYAIQQRIPAWWPALPVPVAAAAALRYRLFAVARSRAWRLKHFYQQGIQRIDGTWPGKGSSGDEFSDSSHLYAHDLNVFGEGSLFELLSIARTAIGRRGLANYLLDTPDLNEIVARQEAVRELEPSKSLREALAVLGEYEFCDAKWGTFAEWLESPPASFPRSLAPIAAVTSSLVAATALAGVFGVLAIWHAVLCLAPLIVFHAALGSIFRNRVRRTMESVRSVTLEIRIFREGLENLEDGRFSCPKLRDLSGRVRGSVRAVRSLERLLAAVAERNKEWFYWPALPLLAGTQLAMAIAHWRVRHGAGLRAWLAAWGEFEALNALANYAHENPGNTFPKISQGPAYFEADGLGHPLLPDGVCVRNNVALNGATRFYMIGGSNMSGKSTLLRAIGLNAVLAMAGAPVRARRLRMSPLAVCASIAVVDSPIDGKSKFLVEVDRLQRTIQTASEKPALFLIDEIFGGTNSRDRRMAAEAVVRTLVDAGAVGAVSTHDISLTEIAEAPEIRGANVHMGARRGGGPMDFDYRLKPGITRETNALAIARMAGVPV